MQRDLSGLPPMVVASVNCPDDLEAAPQAACDVIEWRLDGLQLLPAGVVRDAMAASAFPAMVTARRHDEGGLAAWPDESSRLAAVEACLPAATWVDIEARSLTDPAWHDLAVRAVVLGVRPVVSLHDFIGVPDRDTLVEASAAAVRVGAAVLKVAATPTDLAGVMALARVFELDFSGRFSVMAMGRFGKASRLLFGRAGSLLNYGYLKRPSVPGQWAASDLRALLAEP